MDMYEPANDDMGAMLVIQGGPLRAPLSLSRARLDMAQDALDFHRSNVPLVRHVTELVASVDQCLPSLANQSIAIDRATALCVRWMPTAMLAERILCTGDALCPKDTPLFLCMCREWLIRTAEVIVVMQAVSTMEAAGKR